ncbi:DNA-3-methyladenine glycosylase family protein [Aneurinibacillus aneurinilyticus]|uniref:DNA-3-methyladenine glycosylase II n=1 Tax=Aneurinibacillus aneurinilyticus TaxID=1391 RepID=A0A848CST9_ANEAE|nr:DNA-3-methyladenine glycosylase 2 family protein [Aneurinibacillus aneurinilyticus]NME98863.1 DNA-3-methyladenine glycosylase 2 family protein [Aneurinibacillus aneurinilyticus]
MQNIMSEHTFELGEAYLAEADPVMAHLIEIYGPYRQTPRSDYFAVLYESIVSQQLSVKAAASITSRVLLHFGGKWEPQAILKAEEEDMRALGLSRSKVVYMKDLASFCATGRLALDSFADASNEEIVRRLIEVKGIGKWTAEMFLLFGMGRLNVYPIDDLGIKKAIQANYNLDELPDKKKMLEIGAKWAPYETIASLYLWRSLNNKPAV